MARILVIKHGALGDIFQAFDAFSALRHHFLSSHFTLLTNSAYHDLIQRSPWFDNVLIDDRPPWTDWRHILRIRRILQQADYIIDLQNSHRTHLYFHLLGKRHWSGQHRHALTAHTNPHYRHMHTLTRQRDQLRVAGIHPQPRTIPHWLTQYGPILQKPYCVLVPGSAPHRPAKCWPLRHFIALAHWLTQRGLHPVIVGDRQHSLLGQKVSESLPHVIDLTGKTSLAELAGLLSRASLTVGNDTGPLHIAATMNCPNLTLFSRESDPRRCAPLALTPGYTKNISVNDLTLLSPQRIYRTLDNWNLF